MQFVGHTSSHLHNRRAFHYQHIIIMSLSYAWIFQRAFISGCLLFCAGFWQNAKNMYYEQKFLKRAHFNNNTCLMALMLGKPRAHNERTFAHNERTLICANERTFAQTSAHFKSAYKNLRLPQFGSSRKL